MTAYKFAQFTLDPGARELHCEGRKILLNDRSFEILHLLVQESPNVISKDAIVEKVWNGVAVEDNSVERAIVNIRKALGDDASDPRFIRTVRGRGYHFVGELKIDEREPHPSNGVLSVTSANNKGPRTVGRLRLFAFGLFLSVVVAAAWKSERLVEYVTSDVVFREDFSGKELDQTKWHASGNSVRVEEGIARLTVDTVDGGGRLDSLKIKIDPSRPFTIKSRNKISYNKSVNSNVDFIGTLGFFFSSRDSADSNMIGIKYANAEGEFCYPGNIVKTEGFYLVKGNGDVRINRHHNEGRVGPQTDAIWDTWFDQELVFNPADRMLSLTVNGEQKSRFTITENQLLEAESVYLTIFPVGWWLHHSIEIDYIEVSQPKLIV